MRYDRKMTYENIVGKGEILQTSIFSLSLNVFFPSLKMFSIGVQIFLSSANALNLLKSKNVSLDTVVLAQVILYIEDLTSD